MGFWAREKENLRLWWSDISKREILMYFLLAALLMVLSTVMYEQIGLSGLDQWYRYHRSLLECFLLIFLTELMTEKSLIHPYWRIGYIPCLLWLTIFPYTLTHAINGVKGAEFNSISAYFLTGMGILLLLFFVMNVISKVVMGKRIAVGIVVFLVCFFTYSALLQLMHYVFLGIVITPMEMLFAMVHTKQWITKVLMPHVGFGLLTAFILGAAAYAAVYAYWVYHAAYCLKPCWNKRSAYYSSIHKGLQFIVFLGCLWLLIRWVTDCFPLRDIESVQQYISMIGGTSIWL
jgi:hypothetical protein